MVASGPPDPVRARRARMRQLAKTGTRVGYSLFLVAIVAFLVGTFSGWPSGLVTLVTACLAVGSAVLLPAIVVGYGVRAAEREDRG